MGDGAGQIGMPGFERQLARARPGGSAFGLVLERDLQFGAVGDRAVLLEVDVQLHHPPPIVAVSASQHKQRLDAGRWRGAPLRVRRPVPGSPTRDPSCAVPWWVSLRSVANGRSGGCAGGVRGGDRQGRGRDRAYGGTADLRVQADRSDSPHPRGEGARSDPRASGRASVRTARSPLGSPPRGARIPRRWRWRCRPSVPLPGCPSRSWRDRSGVPVRTLWRVLRGAGHHDRAGSRTRAGVRQTDDDFPAARGPRSLASGRSPRSPARRARRTCRL